ncbi:hypothetical protein DdX_09263 [Ditylenchus destructor]|uniref:Uncharacterized protein n=1 Tax=Ditylenchus destructor TaxID=166010 RepID=A0AAD4N492_9BILA|nr:hypothetical protein DdX_09263 [Ditylenchus destructor]
MCKFNDDTLFSIFSYLDRCTLETKIRSTSHSFNIFVANRFSDHPYKVIDFLWPFNFDGSMRFWPKDGNRAMEISGNFNELFPKLDSNKIRVKKTTLHLGKDHQGNGRVCGLESDQIFERLSKLQHLWIDQTIELQLEHFSRTEASKYLHRLLASPDQSLKCFRLEWNLNHIILSSHMMKSLPETFLDFKFPIHEFSALRRIKELKFQDGTYVTADDLLTYLSLLEDDGIDDQIIYIRFFVESGSKPPPPDYLPLRIQDFVRGFKEPPPQLIYFSLINNIVILCFHSTTLCLMSHLIYCDYFEKTRLKVHTLSSSMLIFLWTHIICAIVDVPYHAYVVWKWDLVKQANYDPYVLYWTGISVNVYYNITSLSVLLLSLDRLLALKFPYRYKARIEAWLPSVSIITIIGYLIVPVILYLMALPLELEKVKFCQSQTCTLTRSKSSITMYLRISTILANLGISGYLLWVLRTVGNKDKLNNRVVKMTIALDILLNAFPSAVAQTGVSAFNFYFVNHVGPMQSVLITANVALCATYTWFILLKTRGTTTQESTIIVAQIKPRKVVTMQ